MHNDLSDGRCRRDHWDAVYERGDVERLGWYEEYPAHSIEMLDRCGVSAASVILDVGSGASTLIPHLLERGHSNLVAADISATALERARERLPGGQADRVTWIVDDVLRPDALSRLDRRVDVWHDRAVFHFLVENEDRARYVRTLRRLVRAGGHVIIAAFSLDGADRCSGLPVRRYDAGLISDALGPEFDVIHAFSCDYIMPSGDMRPYVYTLFVRQAIFDDKDDFFHRSLESGQ